MADSYVQGSFAVSCTHAELALIEEAFEASYAFMAEDTPKDPSPAWNSKPGTREAVRSYPPSSFTRRPTSSRMHSRS